MQALAQLDELLGQRSVRERNSSAWMQVFHTIVGARPTHILHMPAPLPLALVASGTAALPWSAGKPSHAERAAKAVFQSPSNAVAMRVRLVLAPPVSEAAVLHVFSPLVAHSRRLYSLPLAALRFCAHPCAPSRAPSASSGRPIIINRAVEQSFLSVCGGRRSSACKARVSAVWSNAVAAAGARRFISKRYGRHRSVSASALAVRCYC